MTRAGATVRCPVCRTRARPAADAAPAAKRPQPPLPAADPAWVPADVNYDGEWLRSKVQSLGGGAYRARWNEGGVRSQSEHVAAEVRVLRRGGVGVG